MDVRCNLLEKIQAEDFALYETVLYLDGHPNDMHAIEYYNAHRDAVVRLREEYAKKFGPLTIYDETGRYESMWSDGPFPWEKEAN